MNKEYTYLDGKVIVEDENGKKRVIECSDKLDEILVQENLIEVMENTLSKVDKKIQNNNERLNEKKKARFFLLIPPVIITLIMPLYIKFLIGDIASTPFELFGPAFAEYMSVSTFFTIFVGISSTLLCGVFSFYVHSINKELKRELNGLVSEKKKLEECLVIERQKLNELKKSKQSKVESEQFIVRQVDDKAILEGLEEYFQLYYDCGYNEDVYARYYRNGTLYKKLGRYYTETGIKEIESDLEEKGIVKKRVLTKQNGNNN